METVQTTRDDVERSFARRVADFIIARVGRADPNALVREIIDGLIAKSRGDQDPRTGGLVRLDTERKRKEREERERQEAARVDAERRARELDEREAELQRREDDLKETLRDQALAEERAEREAAERREAEEEREVQDEERARLRELGVDVEDPPPLDSNGGTGEGPNGPNQA